MEIAAGILFFFAGASVGSFINLAADRLPSGASLVRPPSHCVGCGKRLTALELVPVLSYLALRGRCSQCGWAIPPRVFVVELTLGLLAVYLRLTSGLSASTAVQFAFAALFVLIAVIDLEHGIVPDALVYPGLALAALLSPWWEQLGVHRSFWGSASPGYLFLGALAGAAASAVPFAAVILAYPAAMGWGDVTLGALVGAVSGIPGALVAVLAAVLSGGLVALGLLLLRLRTGKQIMPFGPFLAFGGILAMLWGDAIWRWYRSLW